MFDSRYVYIRGIVHEENTNVEKDVEKEKEEKRMCTRINFTR